LKSKKEIKKSEGCMKAVLSQASTFFPKTKSQFFKHTTWLFQLHRVEEDDERSLDLFFVFSHVSWICWKTREKVS